MEILNKTLGLNLMVLHFQGKKVQKCVETLDVLKISNAQIKPIVVTTKWETFDPPPSSTTTQWELFD